MKKLREMRNPLKYVQGRDALLSFCKETEYMGKNYLFVCSHSAYEACHDKLEQSFEGTDKVRHYEIFGGISSESEIARMRKIVEEQGIDTVVGVGGGSAVDTAKATAFYEKKHIVIIPTVVATDAPCTGLSVIYHDDGSFKEYLFYPTNPDCVLVDSTVIANAPVRFLIPGAGMVLAKYCYENLKKYGEAALLACEDHVVTKALDNIIEACVYLSGVGADNVNVAAAHSFYNGLTSLGGNSAPHGNCVAFGTLVQLCLEGVKKEEFEEVQDFCVAVGLPITLAELGDFSDADLHTIAKNACVPGETIHNLAGDVTETELYDAMIAADALGKKRKGGC